MKKATKIIIGIICTIVALWGAIFVTDYIRCSSLREPLFAIASASADDGGSAVYHGIGYKVIVKKYIDAEYGAVLNSVEMKMFGKTIAASIT